MVTYSMPFGNHPPDKIRVVRNKISNNEKSSGGIMFFQCIKDEGCVPIFVSGVKGKIYFFSLVSSA